MLVVLIIICLLAGLIMAAAAIITEQQKSWSTRNTMRVVMNLLAGRSAVAGGYPAAVEHPLAGSAICAAGRPLYMRAIGGAVSTTGEALMVENSTWVAGAESRVLKPDDRFDGIVVSQDLPFLFGLRRSQCSILGGTVGIGTPAVTYPGITSYRKLDRPMPGRATFSGGPAYGQADYPDPQHLVSPTGEDGSPERSLETVQRRALEIAIGTGGLDELRRLRCIQEDQGTLILDRRAMVLASDTSPQPTWSPGTYRRADTRWQRYRLRGPVLVDGWGREMLYRSQPSPGLLSAGKDGVFVCDPGPDGIISSSAATVETTRSADDRNGMTDNVTTDPP
ncbi:hypothetical protein LBMAG53_33790 [Planctomycetota bacterium]|nr:hypothetical protein LBMAG53_33790 [Planctomycetota bacterium]